jgi:transcriptional regulator with XRE-family HTH domain
LSDSISCDLEVARRAGLSERRYGNYVSGRREPDLATLVRIASVLAMTPNDLLGSQALKKGPADLARQRATAALAALKNDDLERVVIMRGARRRTRLVYNTEMDIHA